MRAAFVLKIVMASLAAALIAVACFLVPPYADISTEFGSIKCERLMIEQRIADIITDQIMSSRIYVDGIDQKISEIPVADVVSFVDTGAILSRIRDVACIRRWTEPKQTIQVSDLVYLDEALLQEILTGLSPQEEPQNAYVAYYKNSHEYIVVPDTKGSTMDTNAAKYVTEAFREKPTQIIDMDSIGCYKKAAMTAEDIWLNTVVKELNTYRNVQLTYTVDQTSEHIDFDIIHNWLIWDNDAQTVDVVEDVVREYVAELADTYTTIGKSRQFETSTGEYIDIQTGDYGWILDEDAMASDMLDHIRKKESYEGEFLFSQRGDGFGNEHFGGTYVEISIDNQHLWMYTDGECILESDIVTGSVAEHHNTRKGLFFLQGKYRNRTLTGPGYASFVRYWMPFDRGIGMHDASWRTKFGGEIYKTNGSHGCVNLPPDIAKLVYENITYEMPIIVW